LPAAGKQQIRTHIGQRLKHEAALRPARVRQRQGRLVADEVAGIEDVDIHRAWREAVPAANTPHLLFDGVNPVGNLINGQCRFDHDDGVQVGHVPVLRLNADRSRLIDARAGGDRRRRQSGKSRAGVAKVCRAVPHVGSETECDFHVFP